MIKHQAFFEFLAGSDQNTFDWHPVLAGLAVLRLVDSSVGAEPSRKDWASIESVRSAVTSLSEGDSVRAVLLQLVDAMGEDEIHLEAVGRGLLAYGRVLNFLGRWTLACDVFATADIVAGALGNSRISIESNIALGAASRRMADWDASANAYAQAAHLASVAGDKAGALQVEVGLATTQMVRGNLATAESLLDGVIEQVRTAGSNDVLGLALHGRATVALLKGAYADAVSLGYEALEAMGNLTARDALLSDIAAAFAGMGLRDSARDSYLIVAATAQSQWVRWQATLNLMELAALDGRDADFDAYAREAKAAQLDPRLRAYYFLYLGVGQQRFGRDAEADASLAEALAFSEKNQLHQIAHEASAAMTALRSRETSRQVAAMAPADMPPSLRRIASELSSLRQAATNSSSN